MQKNKKQIATTVKTNTEDHRTDLVVVQTARFRLLAPITTLRQL